MRADEAEEWSAKVERHSAMLRRRGSPMSGENMPPQEGQAADWYWDAVQGIPPTGRHVARQLARLCGEDSEVSIPQRSLADAVGITDKAGRHRAFVERGATCLVDAGWLEIEVIGKGRSARTTFRLLPGERVAFPEYDWPRHVAAA